MNSDFEKEVIEKLTKIVTIVEEDHKILHGNGQPGLMARVATLEGEVNSIKGRDAEIKQILRNQADMEREIQELSVRISSTDLKINTIIQKQKWYREWGGRLGWIIMALITIYEVFFK